MRDNFSCAELHEGFLNLNLCLLKNASACVEMRKKIRWKVKQKQQKYC